MDTWQLEYIVTAAHHSNLTSAARELHISQSTLSRTIASVSAQIGTPLFQRGKKLILTPVGERYVRTAQQILEIKRQTYRQINSIYGSGDNFFSIGLSPHTDSQVLLSMLEHFQEEYPQVRMNITESYSLEAAKMVARNQLDISIGIQTSDFEYSGSLRFIPSFWITYVIAISDINAAARGGAVSYDYSVGDSELSYEDHIPSKSLVSLKDIPFVGMDERALGTLKLKGIFKDVGFNPIQIATAAQITLAKRMIREYNATGLVPIDSCKSGDGLRYFRCDPEIQVLKGFYVRKDYRITAMVSTFIKEYSQAMRKFYPLSVSVRNENFMNYFEPETI
ncbi:MAG: LysR family transcriptional regulator [Eubacteriales bacterium]|nr:LysR family transcriptional regulator [Eubacteriales bacterium]